MPLKDFHCLHSLEKRAGPPGWGRVGCQGLVRRQKQSGVERKPKSEPSLGFPQERTGGTG